MDILADSRQISRLEVVDTGRRRRWTVAEKLRIVEESFSGPRLASSTARRHGIFPTLLFAWRNAFREGRLGGVAPAAFVPAIIVPEAAAATTAMAAGGRMEVMSRTAYPSGQGRSQAALASAVLLFQFQGSSSGSRFCGVSAMRPSTSASQACGSTSLSLAVPISVVMAATRSAPRSEPANSHDLRLFRALHNRNYVKRRIMCSSRRHDHLHAGGTQA
jgi:transposase